MTFYSDGWWVSRDGLRLHYRDYPGVGDGRVPVLCLPGLTRNARDFSKLAESLSGPGGWRVLCAEMRGRGLSQYAQDPATYTPLHYAEDVAALLDQAGIDRVAIVGTSLGGIMTMIMAMMRLEGRIAGAVLNDIGPVLESGGLDKIGAYVGADPRFASWDEAAAYQKAQFGAAFPGRSNASWAANARRLMVEDADGTIRFDYDPAIAWPFREGRNGALPDLWPGLELLASRPLLLLRGALSDLLSAPTFAEMRRRLPQAEAVSVPGVGHAPALDEPEAEAAIARWLARVAGAPAGGRA